MSDQINRAVIAAALYVAWNTEDGSAIPFLSSEARLALADAILPILNRRRAEAIREARDEIEAERQKITTAQIEANRGYLPVVPSAIISGGFERPSPSPPTATRPRRRPSMAEPFNAGDPVYITNYGYGRIEKAIISRVTKTQAIIQRERYEQRFRRDDGFSVGSGFNRSRIERPTPKLDREWHQQKVRSAGLALAQAAGKDDADAIREAYKKWDRLEADRDQS